MAFQVSPGVQVKEIDATGVIPAVSTSIGGFVGAFNWGPAEEIRLVSSEDNMASIFSTPDTTTAKYFLTAASFLKYGNALKVVRTVDTSARNANVKGNSALIIKNEDDFNSTSINSNDVGEFISKYPGFLGNSLRIEICAHKSNGTAYANWDYKDEFDGAPLTSNYALNKGYDGVEDDFGVTRTKSGDELHMVVVDRLGYFSGTVGTVLETFPYMSQALDAKDASGTSIYWRNVVNAQSNYVKFTSATADWPLSNDGQTVVERDSSFAVPEASFSYDLQGGVDGNEPTTGNIQTGLDLFSDPELEDVNLLFTCPDAGAATSSDTAVIGNYLIALAESRKDCMAFISPPISDTANSTTPLASVKSYASALNSTSYASLDSGAVYIYDKYNDVYLYIGAAGLCAGLCANTDQVADAWFSPAGLNRGQLRGVAKLAFNPTKAQRDELYKARVNPLVSFPGQGTMLFGDKTLLTRPSAFDRINVRRLFIVLEKAISTASKAQLFEFNDEFTRAQFRNMLEPFLRDVKGRRGVTDFLVVCDESNNTGQVVDSNRFVADIFIKPSRSINFITLNFIATRTGVDFSEVAGG